MRKGFSLIELLTVLTIISMIGMAVGVRFTEPYKSATFQSDLERLVDFDFKIRQHASGANKLSSIVFDLDQNRIEASRWVDDKEKRIGFKTSSHVDLVNVTTQSENSSNGQFRLGVDADGASSTYVVQISNGETTKWVLFAGRTGQHQIYNEETDVEKALKMLRQ